MNNIAVPKTHGNRGAQEASVFFFSLVIYCFSLLYLPVQCPGNWKNQSLHRSYSTGKNKNSVPPSVHTAQTNNSSKRKAGNAFEVLRMFVVGGKGNKFFQTFFVGWVCTQWLVITFFRSFVGVGGGSDTAQKNCMFLGGMGVHALPFTVFASFLVVGGELFVTLVLIIAFVAVPSNAGGGLCSVTKRKGFFPNSKLQAHNCNEYGQK